MAYLRARSHLPKSAGLVFFPSPFSDGLKLQLHQYAGTGGVLWCKSPLRAKNSNLDSNQTRVETMRASGVKEKG